MPTPVDRWLTDLRAKLRATADPLQCSADLRSFVAALHPGRLPEIDRALAQLSSSVVPRLAPRPRARAQADGAQARDPGQSRSEHARLRSQLLALLDGLEPTSPPSPVPAPEGKSPKTADPIWRPTPWVFISSVGEGADEYRASVQRACLRKRMLPIAMESWSAAAKSPAEVCRAHVQECDVMVLLLLHRYGSIEPTTGKSYTELEYEAAHAAGRDILAFEITSMSKVKPLSLDPDDLRRLQQFSAGMKSQLRCKVASAGELEAAVFQALDEWRRQGEREEVR